MAARSKASMYGCWLAGIACSNPARDVDVTILRMLSCVMVRPAQRADQSPRGVLLSVLCL